MRWNFTKTMFAAAALSLPYLCSAAPPAMDDQARDDCMRGLTAPPDVRVGPGRYAPISAVSMFDIGGSQRSDLFVTIRDPEGHIIRQTVCTYDADNQVVGMHNPWPDEETQWMWE